MADHPCSLFDRYDPDESTTVRMRLTSRAAALSIGSRIWCHALTLEHGEIAHAFYEEGTRVEQVEYGALAVILRMGAAVDSLRPAGAEMQFSEVIICGNGVVPACHYVSSTHEFLVLSSKVKRPRQHERATVQLIDQVWTLILALRGGSAPEICDAALMALIAEAVRCLQKTSPAHVKIAMAVLDASDNSMGGFVRVAQKAGVSLSHLCRSFRKSLGVSMREYVRRVRLNRAAGLLWGTKIPIGEVASMCGFFDQAHLTRIMVRQFKVTPSNFRNLAPCRGNLRLQGVKPWELSSPAVALGRFEG